MFIDLNKSLRGGLLAASLFTASLVASFDVLAQTSIPSHTVELRGETPVTIRGRLTGPDKSTKDYVVHVKEGAALSVALKATKASSTHFNILPPNSSEALFVGEMEDKAQWKQQVKVSGNYTVRVYLNRAVARRGAKSDYTLSIASY